MLFSSPDQESYAKVDKWDGVKCGSQGSLEWIQWGIQWGKWGIAY